MIGSAVSVLTRISVGPTVHFLCTCTYTVTPYDQYSIVHTQGSTLNLFTWNDMNEVSYMNIQVA